MALIAPWLNQPDYLGAMRSGAALGLQRRDSRDRLNLGYENLLQGREEAVNRLQLAYDQLASQEQQRQDILEERRQETAARMAEQLRQHDALNLYRQSAAEHQRALEKQAQDRLELSGRHNLALEGFREREVELKEDQYLDKLMEEDEDGEYQQKEIAPGVIALSRQGSPRWQIIKQDTQKELSRNEAASLLRALPYDLDDATRSALMDIALKGIKPPAPPSEGTIFEPHGLRRSLNLPMGLPEESSSQIKTFASEQEARAEGFTVGDVIYLQGVGKVRLR